MKNKITEIHIDGRRWFQKTYGNTYNTTKTLVVFDNGDTKTYYTPMQYGYGDHYKDLAIQNLVQKNVLPKKERHYYHADFKDMGINVYSNVQDVLKRDLHK